MGLHVEREKVIKPLLRLGASALTAAASLSPGLPAQAEDCPIPTAPWGFRIEHRFPGNADLGYRESPVFTWEIQPGDQYYNFTLDDPTTTGEIDGVNKEPDVMQLRYPYNWIAVPLSNDTIYKAQVSRITGCGESPAAELSFSLTPRK